MDGTHGTAQRSDLLARHRLAICVFAHAALFGASLLAAFALAYNFSNAFARGATDPFGDEWGWFVDLFLPLLALALPLKLLVFGLTRQFRGSWRYVGLHDLFGISFSALVASCALILSYFALENFWHFRYGRPLIDYAFPRLHQSVFLLDYGLSIAFVCAAKVIVRFNYEELAPRRRDGDEVRRVLVVGTGDEAESLLREVRRMIAGPYRVVGLLDDRADRPTGSIHGIDVLGRTDRLREIAARTEAAEVWIALSGASPRRVRELVEQCDGAGLRFRAMPALSDVIHGRVQVSHLRDIEIDDLLGRLPVHLDLEAIGAQLRGRRIAVTGAGGSIGAELCRQICRFGPQRLILLERAENALFNIDRHLREQFPGVTILPCVADVTDAARVAEVFRDQRPALVFHAAAHKHVPMMELNVGEAVKNNVGGTRVVAQACAAQGVEKMVLISTDKAVNPTSVMGCSKRVAELCVQGMNGGGGTHFVTVRFGNVLGSDGSVVPIFREQIARGGPVTVTHPQMCRYFMTIPEASQLVLQAGAMGGGGEIFMLDMGEPVKIVDLARNMIRLSGMAPETDIEIRYVGLRPGEKLFEELSIDGEHVLPTAHPQIGVLRHREEDWTEVRRKIDALLTHAQTAEEAVLRDALAGLVPEYTRVEAAPGGDAADAETALPR
ncbi:MAG: polysaccharide biosynthesis protein [Phycisphaerales bacterium]|nr:polysaccharide biosynthesis protein [Phycisphaerales bacterium]